jgi:hypothetical protein
MLLDEVGSRAFKYATSLVERGIPKRFRVPQEDG